MWTDDAREKYRMIARGYPSSMSDAEWVLVKPYFPSPAATAVHGLLCGKDMLHPMRRIVDAIFYVLRNGRALPWIFRLCRRSTTGSGASSALHCSSA